MATYAVYLRPKTSYASPIGSDTLFGALCWAVRAVYGVGELKAMLKRFATAAAGKAIPPFAITSAFPFLYYNDVKVRLYPKPLIPELQSDQVKPLAERERQRYGALRSFQRATIAVVDKAKPVRAAMYVSEELFAQLVRGEIEAFGLCERLVERGSADTDIISWDKALMTHGERKTVQAEELDAFIAEGDVQRNEIERVGLATTEGRLFFTHETFLHRERAGLWFAVRTDDLDFMKPPLRYLADTGIGGERSIGKGHFDVALEEIHELDLPSAGESNCFVSLSRYIPTEGECDFSREPLSYALTTIRPKHEATMPGAGHHTYKRLLRVFEPGSFFPFIKQEEVYGQVVNVGPSADAGGFEAYHNGLAVPVFARVGSAT